MLGISIKIYLKVLFQLYSFDKAVEYISQGYQAIVRLSREL